MLVMEENYLTAEEVAQKLRLNPGSVMRLFKQGKIPGSFKFGGAWRISETDLLKYIEQQKTKK